jgi:hypoxanthine phosphoribosyltransferase
VTVDARILLDRDDLQTLVSGLATRVTEDHPQGVVLLGVLKGALVFTADLARAIAEVPVELDFLSISRYAPDSGRVRILKDVDVPIEGRAVVLVEDLVDTGLTLAYLLGHLEARAPRSLDVCTLLDRTERRIVPVEPRYVGATVAPDAFVVGYGLHVGERYRNLPMVLQVDHGQLAADPAGLLEWYGPAAASPSGAGKGSPRPDARLAREVERRRL